MRYYTVAEMEITDPRWIRDYVANVTGLVEGRGGRYLARTGGIEKSEGERKVPQFIVLIEWPSKEIAEEFFASEDYRPYREERERGALNEFLLVAGEDVNGLAQIAG